MEEICFAPRKPKLTGVAGHPLDALEVTRRLRKPKEPQVTQETKIRRNFAKSVTYVKAEAWNLVLIFFSLF